MCDKMAISAYILKIVEKCPFLRLEMRSQEDEHDVVEFKAQCLKGFLSP